MATTAPNPLKAALRAFDEAIAFESDGAIAQLEPGDFKSGMDPRSPDVFREEPAPLDVFIRDKKFMRGPALSEEQFMALALTETIFFPETYELLNWKYMKQPWWSRSKTEIVMQWGKGSGKDMIARYAVARVCYLVLCLSDPKLYYNMDPDSSIDCLNMATSSLQANGVFFTPLRRSIDRSPWFAGKADPKDGIINFESDVRAVSGHAKSDSLEGLNILIGVADEIAAFKTPQETANRISPRAGQMDAAAAVDMMRSSGQSRFPGIAKILGLSFPRFRGDYIQQWTDQAKRYAHMYSSKKKTWEVNPTKSKKMFATDYARDPDKAAAMYECDPPYAENPYFRNPRIIDEAFVKGDEIVDDLGFLIPGFQFTHRKPCAVHMDLAYSRDRAGISMAHVQEWIDKTTVDGHTLHQPRVFVDFVTSFSASDLGLSELDLPDLIQFVLSLIDKGADIRLVTADQFQSKMGLQTIGRRQIETRHRSVDRDTAAYDVLKYTMRDGRLVIVERERVKEELKKLQIINGIKIDHPVDGSKDEADSLAGAVAGSIEVAEMLLENTVESEAADWTNAEGSFHPSEGVPNAQVPERYRGYR